MMPIEPTSAFFLFIAFFAVVLLQLWYYWGIFSRLAFYKKQSVSNALPPVSVIICARNEDDNILKYLPLVLEQDYPEFEVVVVNDCSYDNTGDVLKELALKHKHLKVVTIKEDEYYRHGKKVALMIGIKGAAHEVLLFTDADCKPNSTDWIKHMVSNYSGETEIVLGYGGYEKQMGLLNRIIRFDTLFNATQYLSFALAGKTYMGVGRNLSYKKSLFFKLKGFASHYHIDSGDDDLFVNEAATKRNSAIEVAVDSFTLSRPKSTWQGWFRQKRRHLTTAPHYNFQTKLRLTLFHLSNYSFWALFILSLTFGYDYRWVLSLLFLRLLSQGIILKKVMNRFNERDLFVFSLLLEWLLLFIYPILTISNLIFRKNKWKR